MKKVFSVPITIIVTFVIVVSIVRWANMNQVADRDNLSISFSGKKLEKILNEKKIDDFEISAYLLAVDREGNSIKIDLSGDALAYENKSEQSGIIAAIDTHLHALFAIKRCLTTADIDLHSYPPPGNYCEKVGWYGDIYGPTGEWIPRHCHCFKPRY